MVTIFNNLKLHFLHATILENHETFKTLWSFWSQNKKTESKQLSHDCSLLTRPLPQHLL